MCWRGGVESSYNQSGVGRALAGELPMNRRTGRRLRPECLSCRSCTIAWRRCSRDDTPRSLNCCGSPVAVFNSHSCTEAPGELALDLKRRGRVMRFGCNYQYPEVARCRDLTELFC